MTETIFLGLLQGLTEFLPVSSSGHLGVAKVLLGIDEPNLSYDLALHAATLAAVCLYFGRDIISLFVQWIQRREPGWHFGWGVIVAVCITGPMGIFLKNIAESASVNPLMLAAGFFFSALLLLSSRLIRTGDGEVSLKEGAVIGFAQGLAVMPGLTRSGTTIWAGLLCGLSREESFRFSFLLSVPTILGAVILQARDVGGASAFIADLPSGWLVGCSLSLVSGLASLALLRRLVIGDRFWLFGIYCFIMCLVSIGISFMGA